jgi:hypothetical protein
MKSRPGALLHALHGGNAARIEVRSFRYISIQSSELQRTNNRIKIHEGRM